MHPIRAGEHAEVGPVVDEKQRTDRVAPLHRLARHGEHHASRLVLHAELDHPSAAGEQPIDLVEHREVAAEAGIGEGVEPVEAGHARSVGVHGHEHLP